MKTRTYFYFVLFVILYSCKKDSEGSNQGNNKVTKYIEEYVSAGLNFKDTFTVNYDNQDRIQSLVSNNPQDRFNFTYNGNTSYTMDIINNGVLDIRFFGYFNTNKLIDSTFQYNNTNDSSTSKILYNSKNQIIQDKNYDYSRITGSILLDYRTYQYDANDNLITETKFSSNNTLIQRSVYEYSTRIGSSPSLLSVGYPKKSKNLIQKLTYYNSSNTITQTVNFEYTFDASNRITSEKQILTGGGVYTRYFYY